MLEEDCSNGLPESSGEDEGGAGQDAPGAADRSAAELVDEATGDRARSLVHPGHEAACPSNGGGTGAEVRCQWRQERSEAVRAHGPVSYVRT